MTRRNFGTRLAAAVAGIGAAATATAALAADKQAKHVCKGLNKCKGQGGGPKGVAGKNSCKGKGGCQVPLKARKSLRRRRAGTELA